MGSGNSKNKSIDFQNHPFNNKNNSNRKILFKPLEYVDKSKFFKIAPPGIKGKSKRIKWSSCS